MRTKRNFGVNVDEYRFISLCQLEIIQDRFQIHLSLLQLAIMSVNLDIRLKRANKVYHEGVSMTSANDALIVVCI